MLLPFRNQMRGMSWCPSCIIKTVSKIFKMNSIARADDRLDKEAMEYFRGIVKMAEYSPRVLELTEFIIRLNPAHYTIWSVHPLFILVLFATQSTFPI